jgi:hypothetical protein
MNPVPSLRSTCFCSSQLFVVKVLDPWTLTLAPGYPTLRPLNIYGGERKDFPRLALAIVELKPSFPHSKRPFVIALLQFPVRKRGQKVHSAPLQLLPR